MYYALFFFLLFLSYYYYYFLFEFSSGFLCLTGDVSVLCTSVRVSVLFNAFLTWKGNRVICCKFESKRVLGICAFACVYTESFFFLCSVYVLSVSTRRLHPATAPVCAFAEWQARFAAGKKNTYPALEAHHHVRLCACM